MRQPGASPSPAARGARRAGINRLGGALPERNPARPRVEVDAGLSGSSYAPPIEDAAG